jgi:hypothetical protein
MRLLTEKYLETYTSRLDVDVDKALKGLEEQEWTLENFRYYTAVSVMSSSRIEDETLEIDSYLKHKLQAIDSKVK